MVSFRLHCDSELAERQRGVMSPNTIRQLEVDTEFSSTVRGIVLEVVKRLEGTKRIVNTDNFYTSVALLRSLKHFGMYGRGTVKESSAHFPKAHMFSKKSNEPRGSSLQGVCSTERVIAASWRDGTTVNVISNADPSSMGEVTRLVGQTHKKFAAPACISEYNKYMQGVDRLDQLRAKYSIADGHSMQKWHLKLALAFIDIARVNGYVTKRMRDNHRSARNPHQDFMAELASEMISGRWKDNVDDGGIFIAELSSRTSPPQSANLPATPTTPTTPAPSCDFVLSSEVFPDATRGKRGCKVCVWEGRTATMKTTYCSSHNVCLCSGTYSIHPDLANIACPRLDWSCWRKYHEFYLPRGLFNNKGHIKRSSTLHMARRELSLTELPNEEMDGDRQMSNNRGLSPRLSERGSSCAAPFSPAETVDSNNAEIDSPRSMGPHAASPMSTQFSDQRMTLAPSGQHNTTTPSESENGHATGPMSTPEFSDQGMTLTPVSSEHVHRSSEHTMTSPFESDHTGRFTSLLRSPNESLPMTSPPTLVGGPFDGAVQNAAMEVLGQQVESPAPPPITPSLSIPDHPPVTPAMSTEYMSTESNMTRSHKSHDFSS